MLHYLASFSVVAAIALFIGVTLVIIEMFIPGFGLPGVCGVIMLALGVFLQAKSPEEALLLLLVIVAILGIALLLMLFLTRKKRLADSPLVLNASIHPAPQTDMQYFSGREGVTMTPLRPSGIADFDGVRLDVVAEAAFVAKDEPVRVIKVEGNRIIVRKIKP